MRNPIVVGVILTFLSVAFLFQNCSPVNFGESTEFASSASRKIEVDPTYDVDKSEAPVKILLIVDNSGTMVNSQQNLSRNLAALLKDIQNYNAEIKVVTTTFSVDTKNCNPANKTCPGYPAYFYSNSYTATSSSFAYTPSTQLISYKILANMTAQQRQSVLTSISNQVLSLGTAGGDEEAPLGVLASQLEGANAFLKKGDRALIYILTDEDDIYSVPYLKGAKVSSVTTTGSQYAQQPGVYYSWVNGYEVGGRCPIRRENGEIISYQDSGVVMPSCDAAAIANLTAQGCLNVSCNPKYFSGEALLSGATVTARCAALQAERGQTLSSCVAMSLNVLQPTEILSDSKTFFMGMTKEQAAKAETGDILRRIKSNLDDLLGVSYLLAISANLPSANCTLKTGQTQDKLLTHFASLFSPAQVVMNSLCSQSVASGDALASISAQFNRTLNQRYTVLLAGGERIVNIVAKIDGMSTVLREGVDYMTLGSTFQLIKDLGANPQKFEVYIGN